MRALSDPGIVTAYFYSYGHAGEGYGFTDVLAFLCLLFPRLCSAGVSLRLRGYGPTKKQGLDIPNQA